MRMWYMPGRFVKLQGVEMTSAAIMKQKNVERLIASCEKLVSGKGDFQGKEWKLSQSVAALRKQITELERYPSVDQDKMHMFQQKVSVLEEVVRTNSADPQPTVASLDTETSTGGKPLVMRPYSQGDADSRAELFSKSTDDGVPRQRGSSAAIAAESSEVAMERQRRNQETIAEEMVDIARKLKHSAQTAKNIITSDTKTLTETNVKAEENIGAVETQTGRMKEHNRGCPWGTILLLVLVFCIFLVMVIFIRIVPKPRS